MQPATTMIPTSPAPAPLQRRQARSSREGWTKRCREPDQLLVLDIETIRDARTPPSVAPDAFPKPVYHQVVTISYVVARIETDPNGGERYVVERCRSGGEPGWSEAELVSGFWRYFSAGNYRLVTWNGARFDMAVLRHRAMLHGVETSTWYRRGDRWNGYGSRFSEEYHCDVMQCLSDRGGTQAMGLDETARLLGLPGKVGAHGSLVDDLVKAGRLAEVNAYCECDALNTFLLYLRWSHLSGRCSREGHDNSARSLVDYLTYELRRAPHFGEFLEGWRDRFLEVGST